VLANHHAERAGQRAVLLALAILWAAGARATGPQVDLSSSLERGFRDETPIVLDLDGDGRSDAIQPRTFEFRRWKIPGVAPAPDGLVEYFVAFDLETAAKRRLGSIFRFRFGTENGGYESYSLQLAGDVDGDGRNDLAFHVGGKRPEELVLVLDRGDSFLARTSGPLRCTCVVTPDLRIAGGGEGAPAVAQWDPESARFRGAGVVWVVGALGVLRLAPSVHGLELARIPGGSVLRRLDPPAGTAPPAGWMRVEADGTEGWISERMVADRSPLEWK